MLPRWVSLLAILGGSLSSSAETPSVQPIDLDQAFIQLRTYTWSQSREPLNAIEKAIQTSVSDPDARKQLEGRLVEVLRTGASFPARQYVCRKLSQIGSADSIPALAALLIDPALSHPARLALERISDWRVVEALRQALPRAEGNTKVGIINSLGVLRDPAAVDDLANLLANQDAATAVAAASALGHIATVEAASALGESRTKVAKTVQAAVIDSWLLAAVRLSENGHPAEAADIFRALYTLEQSAPVRLAAFKGLVATEPEHAFELLSHALAGDDDLERGLAARIIGDGPSPPDLKVFIKSFQTYPPSGQVALLEACRTRNEAAARPAALAATENTDAYVRIAGLRALATIGTATEVPMLARLAAGDGEEKTIARAALASLPGKDVNAAILSALTNSSPDVSVELLNALAARGAEEAGNDVAARLTDSSEPVRTAALKALATLGSTGQVRTVISLLKAAASDSDRETAQGTLAAIAQRAGTDCVDSILKEMAGVNTDSRIALLRTLGIAGGTQALDAVRVALTQGDARVKEAAFRVLTEWSSIDAAPELMLLAQTSVEPNRRVLAFRGYVRLAGEADCPSDTRLRLLSDAMKMARDTDEKRLVIAALGEQSDLEALKALKPCFEVATLAQETCVAVVRIASAADPQKQNETVPFLRQALKISTSQDVRQKARAILQRLGANPE